MSSTEFLTTAVSIATDRWQNPSPLFTSGHDLRSSEQGMLLLFYGGLDHAARYSWLNAGRALIDKTYLRLLFDVEQIQGLKAAPMERVAYALDGFIRKHLPDQWASLATLDEEAKMPITLAWQDELAHECFGSIQHPQAASYLMFYLFPMLPVFPMREECFAGLVQLGHSPADMSYPAYHQACLNAYRELRPELESQMKLALSRADQSEQTLLENVTRNTDWWSRRLFAAFLACN